jgi:Fe-S-cluster containining protein
MPPDGTEHVVGNGHTMRPTVTDDEAMDREVANLDRQVQRSGVRTQQLFNRSFERLSELEAMLLGLVDRLVAAGVVDTDDLVAAARRVDAEVAARGEGLDHLVILREDPPDATTEPVVVDCAARMPVCHAVCCKLSVSLSAAEVETGRLRWDLGHPYRLRREADGRCTHLDRETGWCGVYQDRPRTCRTYTCATDGRIWKDFAAVELNTEWLAAHFGPDEPRFAPAKARVPLPMWRGTAPGVVGREERPDDPA